LLSPASPQVLFTEIAPHKSGKSAQDIADEIAMATRRREAALQVEASADEYLRDNQVVNAGIAQTPSQARPAATAVRKQSAAERYGLVDIPAKPQAVANHDISHLQEELAEMRLLLEEQLSRLGAEPPGGQKRVSSCVQRRLERMGLP